MKKHILIFAHIEIATTIAAHLQAQGSKAFVVSQTEEIKNTSFEQPPFIISRNYQPHWQPPKNYEPEPHKYFDKPKHNFKKR